MKQRVILKKPFAMLIAAGCLAALFLLSLQIRVFAEDTIEKGVFVETIELSGMTQAQAKAAVDGYVSRLGQTTVTLKAMNDNSVTVTAADMGLSWDNSNVVSEAVGLGKAGNIVQRYKALKDLEHQNHVYPLEISYDDSAIRRVIEEKCLQYNVEPVDGSLKRDSSGFVITPGQTGVSIDVGASVDLVKDALMAAGRGEAVSVELAAKTTEPRGTEEQLSAVKDVLGSFTTSFSSSGANRSGNVKNGASKINGTLLYPGEEFSTYRAVSPFTEENGYYLAGSYNAGLVVESLGGGICQVSTTLYNAVLKAELEVTQRSNHSMIVGYVDPSQDAAISGQEKDFKFINNTDYPIYIEGYTTGDKHISFIIYGHETRPSNRKVSFVSNVLSKTEPEGEKVVADPSQRAGYVSVQSPHTGYKAELLKVVTVDGVEESRTRVNSSTYNAVPRTASVGTQTDNPAVASAISAAIASGSIEQCRATAASINAGTYTDPAALAQQQAEAAQAAAIAAQQQAIAEQQAQQQAAAEAAAQAAVTVEVTP